MSHCLVFVKVVYLIMHIGDRWLCNRYALYTPCALLSERLSRGEKVSSQYVWKEVSDRSMGSLFLSSVVKILEVRHSNPGYRNSTVRQDSTGQRCLNSKFSCFNM